MHIYLSGGITGYEDNNFPAFNKAAKCLRDLGHTVFNPAETGIIDGWTWHDYMKLDIPEVCKADAIVTLPDWQHSVGASFEVLVASKLEIPHFELSVFDLVTL